MRLSTGPTYYPVPRPLRFASDETKKPANKISPSKPSPRPEDYDLNDPKTPLWAVASPRTKWGKKHSFGWTKIGLWGEGKIDIAVMALFFLSAFIHPLMVIGIPLFIARCLVRYIQGLLTPADRIDAYREACRNGENPNVYKWK